MEWSDALTGGLLAAVPDAVLVLGQDRRIVLAGDRALEVFGRARADLLGRSVDEMVISAHSSTRGRRRDGSEFPAEVSFAAVGDQTVMVIRDVSERVALRAEVHAQRQRRLEALGQLAGGVAHDFNNLLGVITNYASFVIEEAESPQPDASVMAADAKQVLQAGERGTALTHRLLKFARRDVSRPQVLDVNEAVAAASEELRATAGDGVRLIVRPAAELPPVSCDPGQLEQLLVNLAANARDAMPAGGNLVIDTAVAHLAQDEHPELAPGDYVRLRVCDSGRGMTPDVIERAFEPFFTTRPNHEATGLGLASVHGMVTQAGGGVSIASEPGVGTTVTVLFPTASSPSSSAPSSEPGSSSGLTGNGETLLVVDDETALRDVAGRILSGAGYHVLAADGGPKALELAALHEGAIDLLVSDVVMPGMLGNELAERLVDARPDTRVLFMSGYAQPVLASQGTLDPGVALLEKPFTAEDLLAAVRRRLDGVE
ncbi:PAS domain-containing hybrid sensor histidine kinase/response regulator [Symbioplanes lichenis]|uniref:PAS domain-containing hybrid sensor histidine kinase/response regulator n=1 Tax=Symbioplanes lichenis TaxID=1629072 RepID=UPI0027386CA4|nr:PAS domain-containing hybrid sensor histidine kinase/response regulator [Actinoplanes lichenis]